MQIQNFTFIRPLNGLQNNNKNFYNYTSDISFQARRVKPIKANDDIVKKAAAVVLMSLTAFKAAFKIFSKPFIEEGISSGNLPMVEGKVDMSNPATQKFIDDYKKSRAQDITKLSVSSFAKLLGIKPWSVNWHIQKGHIEANADGTIDVTNRVNRYFMDNFSKKEHIEMIKYTPETYSTLQKRLGKLPLEYCLKYGLIRADKDGNIDATEEANRVFIEKVENKEISEKTYLPRRAEFARMVGVSKSTVLIDCKKGLIVCTEDDRVDVNDPVNKKYIEMTKAKLADKANPNLVNPNQLAKMLGYTASTVIREYIAKGTLVAEKSGLIDITKMENALFISRKQTEGIKLRRKRKVKETETTNPNIVTQKEFAEMVGTSQGNITWHIAQGNIIRENLKIDITHPVNKYFLETFKKRARFVPMDKVKIDTVKPKTVKKAKVPQTKVVDFNQVNLGEFSAMTGLTYSPIRHYSTKGELLKTEDNKINLSDPVNIEFIRKHEEHAKEKFSSMSDSELLESVESLKDMLYRRMGMNIYIVSENLIEDNDEDIYGYLKFSLENIVDTENLTEKQISQLVDYMTDIVFEVLDDGIHSGMKFYKSETKLNLHTFKYLLDEIAKRPALLEESPKVEKSTIVESNVVESDEIVESEEFKKYYEVIESAMAHKVQIANELAQKNVSEMMDAYLYNKFLSAQNNQTLYLLGKDLATGKMFESMPEGKINIIVEKVLFARKSDSKNLLKEFESWKSRLNTSKVEAFIEGILREYKQNIIKNIYSDRALEMLQEANPSKNITKEDFIEYVTKKLGLE